MGTTFEGWMREVNHWVNRLVGLDVDDLADVAFRDWFDDGHGREDGGPQGHPLQRG